MVQNKDWIDKWKFLIKTICEGIEQLIFHEQLIEVIKSTLVTVRSLKIKTSFMIGE